MDIIKEIAKLIKNANYLVVFTGAGISTESGLPDFRGPEGVWTLKEKGLRPKKHLPVSEVTPNIGHMVIKELQDLGYMKFLISQNVDNLHLRSGINPQLLAELHGNHSLLKCLSCDSRFSKYDLNWKDELFGKGYRKDEIQPNQPVCPNCSGRIISSIINFGDPMPESEMNKSIYHSKKADVYLIIGSSLVVHPAASLPRYCYERGGDIIIINKGETPLDSIATFKIEEQIGPTMQKIISYIKEK